MTLGNYDRFEVSGRIEGPLVSDKLAAKISVRDTSREGYFHNLENGSDYGKSEVTLVRGTLLATPRDDFDATLILESYKETGDSVPVTGIEVPGTIPYQSGYRRPADFWDVRLNNPGPSKVKASSATLEANWKTLGGVITSITGYRDVNVDNFTDDDGTQFSLFDQSDRLRQHQFSQELRYASQFSDFVDFTTGLYYLDHSFTIQEGRDLALGTTKIVTASKLQVEVAAVFAEADFLVTEALTVTLGARGQYEKKEARSSPFRSAAALCPGGSIYDLPACTYTFGAPGEESWKHCAPKIGLSYEPAPNHLLFLSATRGFRSGGFSMRGNPIFSPFDAESVMAYEVGHKADLLDRRLRVNTAIYHNRYKDLQRTVLGFEPAFGTVSSTFNVADAIIQGVELEVVGEVTENLILSAGYGLTDAEYRHRQSNFFERNLLRVPRHSGNWAADYKVPIGDFGDVKLRVAGSYTGSQYIGNGNLQREGDYWVYDASSTYTDPSRRWTVSLFAKNLTNEKNYFWSGTLGALGEIAFAGSPRTYGVRIGYEF